MSVVIVTGATGASGRATCAALLAAGHSVAAVGRDADRLAKVDAQVAESATDGARLTTHVADVTEADAVSALVTQVKSAHGRVDGLAHLVGGWRGGKAFADNSDDDWRFLSVNLVESLRHLTLALHDDLVASPAGRVVIVSAAAAAKPTAGNANYATAKSAAEAWMLALADSFRRLQSGRKTDPTPQTATAVIGVVSWIGDDPKASSPTQVAAGIRAIVDGDAAELNGARVTL
ncbi:SDR family NAD(P)-dependent oxidoreductase [Terracoccus luteus]|uniref:NADP-dependent 3-hydroxy acid dehydrogenase YdfG n=1 Tax=Terracoccus luteus TaxID=53356 RepID=A0A839Q1X3_9MICO|nr:SDR family oxidoreductase [Terracoccus luteus]MBB2988315.1 NADP-dependent 3-hydroxy acid dehydrogenase YdfG [Terracoccus luteus]MCP2173950.1 NADP-dependent 3-hydroxy acid dehydrogenase YdfG [Terracoccus luteus]